MGNQSSGRRLFLDDERFPPEDGNEWHIVRSVSEAIDWVRANGWPDFVGFDNDLGDGQREGWEFAQWLIDEDLDNGGMPENFSFWAHSRNSVRQKDIEARLSRYIEYKSANKSENILR